MAGPSGFVQRFKGKVDFPSGGIWIGGASVGAAASDLNVNTGWGTVFTSTSSTAPVAATRSGGLDILAPTPLTGGSIYRLPTPAAGVTKIIEISTINGSTIVFLTASTAGTILFTGVGSSGSTALFGGAGGSTLSNTVKSTQGCQIELIGVSTVAWLFNGVTPSTVGALTFSTST